MNNYRQDYVPILKAINMQCTAEEQEWIIRIILKGKNVFLPRYIHSDNNLLKTCISQYVNEGSYQRSIRMR